MSKKIKFSIVVAVYNRPYEMIDLLESLKIQTFNNFELIIVDDGSDISSREVFQKYRQIFNISYFYTENNGPALARNFGVEKTNGEWIIFFDSDCTIPYNYFSIVNNFLKNNNIDFFGGPDMMDKSFSCLQKSINFSMTSFYTTGGIRGNKNSVDKFLPRSFNMGIKKEAFEEVNGFSDIRQYGEDLDLSYKLLLSDKKSALISDAKVYHKRRTNIFKFLNQMFKSGKGRRFLDNKYKGKFRFYHLFPSLFIFGLILLIFLNLFESDLNKLFSIIYVSYFIVIFVSSSIVNLNPLVGAMSVITTFVQFLGYGTGYIYALFRN